MKKPLGVYHTGRLFKDGGYTDEQEWVKASHYRTTCEVYDGRIDALRAENERLSLREIKICTALRAVWETVERESPQWHLADQLLKILDAAPKSILDVPDHMRTPRGKVAATTLARTEAELYRTEDGNG
jgi:hypothetical protein